MPHVTIRAYPVYPEEAHQALAKAITEDVMKYFNVPERSVSVSIKIVEKENWKEETVDAEMLAEGFKLLKEPGYDMHNLPGRS